MPLELSATAKPGTAEYGCAFVVIQRIVNKHLAIITFVE